MSHANHKNWARKILQRLAASRTERRASKSKRLGLVVECLEGRVTPSGLPPTAAAIPRQVVNEDAAAVTIKLNTVFSDPENDALTYSVVQTNSSGLVTPSITGADLKLTFGANLFGYSYVRVTANDGTGSTTAAFEVLVNSVDDLVNDTALGTKSAPLVINVLGNDGAGDGQRLAEAANIDVVQNDTGNTQNVSVTVTMPQATPNFQVRPGSSRGDFNIQIGASASDDVAGGLFFSTVRENTRDNQEGNGEHVVSSMIDSDAGGLWVPTADSGAGAEYNANVAAAYFPYSAGWLGGWAVNAAGTNGGANDSLRTSTPNSGFTIGTAATNLVQDQGSGQTRVRIPGVNSATDGVLLAVGAKNEDNFSLSSPNADGSWQIATRDNGTTGTSPTGGNEQDYTAFIYVPKGMPNVVAGRIMGDGSVQLASGNFTVTKTGTGKYELAIPGQSPLTGVLMLSPEGGSSTNADNFTTYAAKGDNFEITSWDIVSATINPVPEDVGATTRMASFVFVPFLNGPPLRVTSVQSAANVVNKSDLGATLTLNPDGTVGYDPASSTTLQALPSGQLAVDTFTYSTTSITGATTKATVKVTVGSGNIASVGDLDNGALVISARPGTANNFTISNDGTKYTFTDPADTIALTQAAAAAGFTGGGTNTITGPSSAISAFILNTGDGNDTITLNSLDDPFTIDGGGQASDTLAISNSLTFTGAASVKGVGSITAASNAKLINPTGTITLIASNALGTNSNPILTRTGTLNLGGGAGGIFLTEDDGVSATAAATDGSIRITNNAGDLNVAATTTGAGIINLNNVDGTLNISAATSSGTGNITLTSGDAITMSGSIGSTGGAIAINANTDGAGSESYDQKSASVSTGNTTVDALKITVNTTGGTGNAILGPGTVGTAAGGGDVTVNANGGSILWSSALTVPGFGGANTATLHGSNYLLTTSGASSSIGTLAAPIQTDNNADLNSATLVAGTGGIYLTDWGSPDLVITNATAQGAGNIQLVAANASGHNLSILNATTGSGSITAIADDDMYIGSLANASAITPGFIGDANFSGTVSLLANRDAGNEQRITMRPGSIIQTKNTTANAILMRTNASDNTTGDGTFGGITLSTVKVGDGGTITLDTAPTNAPASVGNILQQDDTTIGLDAGATGTVVLNAAGGLNVSDPAGSAGIGDSVSPLRVRAGNVKITSVNSPVRVSTIGNATVASTIVVRDTANPPITTIPLATLELKGESGVLTIAGPTHTDGGTILATSAGGIVVSGPLGDANTGDITLDAAASNVTFNTDFTVFAGQTVTLIDGNRADLGPKTTINGTLVAANGVALSAGDLLQGTGTVNASLLVTTGSSVNSGPGSGILATGNTTVNGALGVELKSDTVGTGYDQLNVTGTVNLTGATLNLDLSYLPAIGTKYTIINNDGSDAVTGTFANTFPLGAGRGLFTIAYNGGDGNDVVLTLANIRPSATFDPVVPNPRDSGLATATITFSEPVTGFDVADLKLTRNGVEVPLTGVTISGAGPTYSINGLSGLTNQTGLNTYVLTVDAATSGIQDLGTPAAGLVQSASVTWLFKFNFAPVLDNSGAMALTDVFEDDAASSGTLVSAIIASAGGDRITDANNDPEGIAVTAVDTTKGSWEYSLDNGGNWLPLSPVSDAAARLLAANANTRVRLVPAADFTGKIASGLTFRAWDRNNGTNGGVADTTQNGNSTSFSAATETASLYVMNVPDVKTLEFQDGLNNYAGTDDTELAQAAADDTNLGTSDPTGGLLVDFNDSGATNFAEVLLRFGSLFGNGPGQIPLGSIIVSANLVLTTNNSGHGGSFNRMLVGWDETVDTWNTFGNGQAGHNTTPGVQANNIEARSAFESFAGPPGTRDQLTGTGATVFGVTADLQAWSNGQANNGWALMPWDGGTDGWAFRSSEATDPLEHPKLVVKYLPAGSASVVELRQGVGGYSGTVDTETRQADVNANRDLAGESFVDAAAANDETQALLRFNNLIGTTPLSIPAGAAIAASSLIAPSTGGATPGDGGKFSRMLVDWAADDSWAKFGSGTAGRNSTPGVQADDKEALSAFSFQIGNETLAPNAQAAINVFDATKDVQAWVNGAANYGWVGLPWAGGSDGWAIDQSERANESFRPKLVAYYVNPEHEFAQLDINAGALSYLGGGGLDGLGIANNLTVSLAAGNYTFADPNGVIVLTPAAITAGWTGSGTNTVTGPSSSVSSIAISTGSRADTITVSGADDPISVNGGFSAGDTIAVTGPISASGDVSLFGADTIALSTGTISSAGTVYLGNITGSATGGGAVNVSGTGTLGGNARIITGPVTVGAGASVVPGVGPGKLDTGNLTLGSGATLKIEINGAAPVASYDQVNVTGTVNVTGATLNLTVGYTPVTGTTYTIINNDGADAVIGTFAGLAQGATVTAGGQAFTISYTGGDGNDVVLTSTTTNVATTTTLVATPLATTGGSSVMFTATVAPSPGALGTVTFRDNGVPIPGGSNIVIAGGQAVFSTTALSAGTHPVTAAFNGAAGFLASNSNVQNVVITGGSATPPTVVSVTPNGGVTNFTGAQRSRIVNMQVVFDQAVLLDTDAMTLALHSGNVNYAGNPTGTGQPTSAAIPGTLTATPSTDNKTWTLTWSGANTDVGSTDQLASLRDGVYDLVIDAAKVHLVGAPTVNMAANVATVFHRLFGDTNAPAQSGNGFTAILAGNDNLAFRGAFNKPVGGGYVPFLDFNGDGNINSADNLAFRGRFNKSLTWTV